MNMKKLPLCFLVILSLSNAFAQTGRLSGKVIVFPRQSQDSYVTLIPHLEKPLKAFTVCLKFYTDLTRAYSLFSFATQALDNEILLYHERDSSNFSLTVGNTGALFQVPEAAFAPRHLCASWESESGIAELWVDGKPMVRKALQRGYVVQNQPKIILGQDQDSFGGKFDEKQSLVGDIGDIFMWDFALSPGEINSVYLGGTFSSNVLDWTKLKFEQKGYVVIKPKLWT
ncbi:C-reactive protein-like isoform X3 [Antechinus flavipes]|uniref:C-reactive protein-like isoform X3 n=1 Tax=Antechinus flavipes TaxID=38775 RepID=UPI00223685B4|nr:C-reactive protein-like isoform X3 [Antechinus flavipes]